MCQALTEGGRRCAVHRHDSLAAVNLAVAESGLTEKQVSDVFTELRREGRTQGRGSADVREWTTYLRELKASDAQAQTRPENGVNIQKAFDGEINAPDKATFYALKNLKARVDERKAAQAEELRRVAVKTQRDPEKVEAKYQAEIKKVDVSRKAEVPAEYTESAVKTAQEKNLPSDRASVVALAKVAAEERAERRSVSLEDVDSTFFARAGYDPQTQRMEVSLRAAPDTVLSYKNVSPETWQEFSENYSVATFNSSIRSDDTQYDSPEEAESEAHAAKCEECGQFKAVDHSCPPVVAKAEPKPKAARGARKATAAKKVTVASTEEPAQAAEEAETAAQSQIDPLDHPDRAISGVRHIQAKDTEAVEYVATEEAQVRPKNLAAIAGDRVEVSLDEMAPGGVIHMRMISKDNLKSYLGYGNSNIPAETMRKVDDAPEGTVFALNNASWVRMWNAESGGYGFTDERVDSYQRGRDVSEISDLDIAFTYNSNKTRIAGSNLENRTVILESRPEPKESPDKVYTSEEAYQRSRSVHERIGAGRATGEILSVSSNASFTRRFLVDGSLKEQPKVKFGKASEIKAGLKAGKVVVSPIHMMSPVKSDFHDNGLDDQGYKQPSGGYYNTDVTGHVGMRYNESTKTVEISDEHTHLRCECYDYRTKYYCAHIDYTRRHAANIGRQNLPVKPSHSILTATLSRKPNVKVIEREGGDPYISMVHRETRTESTYGYYTHRAVRVNLPEGVQAADVNRDQLREIMTDNQAMLSVANFHRIKSRTLATQALKRADTELPVSFTFKYEQSSDRPRRYEPKVTGAAVFKKTNDPNNLTVVSHTLKCTCPDYAENYDCKHVRGAAKHAGMVMVADGHADGSSLFEVGRGRNTIRDTEESVQRAMFVMPDRDPEEVRAAIEEARLEEERQAAIREERERQEELERMERIRRAEEEAAAAALRAEAAYDDYRARLVDRYSSAEPTYTNNPEKFFTDAQKAAKNKEFDYAYENVLGGSATGEGARKFGVELEFVMDRGLGYHEKESKLRAIAQEMHAEGLSDSPSQGGYHSGARSGWAKWSFERDCTVDGEIVSPLLGDDKESWEQLEKVCQIVKKHGGKVNSQAGSHVHVSTGSYGHSTAKHGELNRTVTQNEDLMYRLAANPHTGSHRGTRWCSPNIVDSQDDIPESVRRGTGVFRTEHSSMLNMGASSHDHIQKSHVEFRMWDGTLDPGVIQRQVMASVAMTDHAEQSVIKNSGSKKPTTGRKKHGESRRDEDRILAESGNSKHNAETFMATNADAARFFDTVFSRQQDREKVLQLFAANKWQS